MVSLHKRQLITIFAVIVFITSSVIIYQRFEHQNMVIGELTDLSNQQQMQITELESTLNTTEEQLSNEILIKNEFEKELVKLRKISVSHYAVVGVNSRGEGVIIPLEVTIKNGNGSLFLDVTNILYDESLQSSVQRAIEAASEITRYDLARKDIFISMNAPRGSRSTEIAGGSGGAAMTIAIIAAMMEYNLSQDILITGTIERDHIIGEVSSVKQKGMAARKEGATGFIVPPFQGVRVPGLEVVEVLTIEEAWKYIVQTTREA